MKCILTFGLLPLWISIIFVLLIYFTGTPAHMLVAPWAIIMAVPLCGITLLICALVRISVNNNNAVQKQKNKTE